MEDSSKAWKKLKKIYAHLFQLDLRSYLKSQNFEFFCIGHDIENIWGSLITQPSQNIRSIQITPQYDLSLPPIPEHFNRYTFPDLWTNELFKEFLLSIYSIKEIQFPEIVITMIRDYSKWNKDLQTGNPIPIDEDIITSIAFDLIDLDYAEEDLQNYFGINGYDLNSYLELDKLKIKSGYEEFVEINQKIDRLESDALTIENDIQHLLVSVENSSNNPGGDFGKWKTLDRDLTEYHTRVIKNYESWYTQSHFLIQNYYDEKEPEFKELHDGKMMEFTESNTPWDKTIVTRKRHAFYGISDLLQFRENIKYRYDPQSVTQQILGLFSKQQGILHALSEISTLLPYKKIKETQIVEPQVKELTPSQQIYIQTQANASQTNETTISIQSISQVNDFIDKTISDKNKINELKQEIKKFESINNKQDYLKQYQTLVGTLADHITVFVPVLQFLLQHVPK